MTNKNIKNQHATLTIPGDKSISHRALLFNSLTKGTAHIDNLLMGEDVLSTIECLRRLGIKIRFEANKCILIGGEGTFRQPTADPRIDLCRF